jgi:hypothetical protein
LLRGEADCLRLGTELLRATPEKPKPAIFPPIALALAESLNFL